MHCIYIYIYICVNKQTKTNKMKTLNLKDLNLKLKNDKDVLGNPILRLVNDLGWTIYCQVIEFYGPVKYEYFVNTSSGEKVNIKF